MNYVLKSLKYIITLILFAVLMILVSYPWLYPYWETTSSRYKNFEEVMAMPEVFEADWVPDWLPQSSYDISESHNIDSNETWIKFNFRSIDTLVRQCRKLVPKDLRRPDEEAYWHFPNFVKEAVKNIRVREMEYYECFSTTLSLTKRVNYLFVDRVTSTGYIWRI